MRVGRLWLWNDLMTLMLCQVGCCEGILPGESFGGRGHWNRIGVFLSTWLMMLFIILIRTLVSVSGGYDKAVMNSMDMSVARAHRLVGL